MGAPSRAGLAYAALSTCRLWLLSPAAVFLVINPIAAVEDIQANLPL